MPLPCPDIEVFPQGLIDFEGDVEHLQFYEEVGLCVFNPRVVERININLTVFLENDYEPPDEKTKQWLARWARR